MKENFKSTYSKGATLFEIMLYVSLFSILSTSVILLYISSTKTVDIIHIQVQKREIGIFIHQLTTHQLATSHFIDISKLRSATDRILKYYPTLKLRDLRVEYVHAEYPVNQIIDTRISSDMPKIPRVAKITFELEYNSRKTYMNTVYIDVF